MWRILCLLFVTLFTGCGNLTQYIIPDRAAIHSGFSWSAIQGDDIQAVPAALRVEYNTNRLIRLNPRYGRLDLGIEAFGLSVIQPGLNEIVGITPLLRYSYPLHPRLRAYLEGGAGPIYLGVDTFEQERSGFSFYDQVGAGIELELRPRMSLILGYRFSHISHGRVLRTRNRGIEGDSLIIGLSIGFP